MVRKVTKIMGVVGKEMHQPKCIEGQSAERGRECTSFAREG